MGFFITESIFGLFNKKTSIITDDVVGSAIANIWEARAFAQGVRKHLVKIPDFNIPLIKAENRAFDNPKPLTPAEVRQSISKASKSYNYLSVELSEFCLFTSLYSESDIPNYLAFSSIMKVLKVPPILKTNHDIDEYLGDHYEYDVFYEYRRRHYEHFVTPILQKFFDGAINNYLPSKQKITKDTTSVWKSLAGGVYIISFNWYDGPGEHIAMQPQGVAQ
jgi:hypothetical protein